MALRYSIELDCLPRQILGGGEMVELVALRELATQIAGKYRQEQGEDDPARMRFRQETRRSGEEPAVREWTVAEVLLSTAPLDELAGHCAQCPASVTGRPFGCLLPIHFPISAAGERWLLDRIRPEAPGVLEAFSHVFQPAREQVERLANWRRTPMVEAPEEPTRQVGGLEIRSNELLAWLLLGDVIEPGRALTPLLLFDALLLSDGRRGDALLDFLQGLDGNEDPETLPQLAFSLGAEESDEQTIIDFKMLLFSLYSAFRLQAPVVFHG